MGVWKYVGVYGQKGWIKGVMVSVLCLRCLRPWSWVVYLSWRSLEKEACIYKYVRQQYSHRTKQGHQGREYREWTGRSTTPWNSSQVEKKPGKEPQKAASEVSRNQDSVRWWSSGRSIYLQVEGALSGQSHWTILYHEDCETSFAFGNTEVIGVLDMSKGSFGREVGGWMEEWEEEVDW